jgi:hypothetical protein
VNRLGVSSEEFFREYGDAVVNDSAAVFAGAGLSCAAGYVNWRELLQEFADDLGIDLDIEYDLVSVAQYHINAEGGTRTRLNRKIVDEFSQRRDVTPAQNVLAQLPIRVFWTTNYDDLLERAIEKAGKTAIPIATTERLATPPRGRDVNVFKLHGDLRGHVVITRDDYEEYVEEHPGFRDRLRSDLMAYTFLFLGFSFSDPHLELILSEIRRIFRRTKSPPTHFALLRREPPGDESDKPRTYAVTRQRLLIDDLKRYGIRTLVVDDYDEIPVILGDLRMRYLRRQVFVSGAAADYRPRGKEWLDEFGLELGRALMENSYNVVNGLGIGIGNAVLVGALEFLYAKEADHRIDQRLRLRPFPLSEKGEDYSHRHTAHRRKMLATVGFAVFIAGNRRTDDGKDTEPSSGVIQEFEIARENDVYCLPIGASGSVAQDLWTQMNAKLDDYFPSAKPPRESWQKLNDASAGPTDVVEAVLNIMKALRPS